MAKSEVEAVGVVRRYFVLALRDVLPLDKDGWSVVLHTDDCPGPPCTDLLACRGSHVQFVQRPAPDRGYADSITELSVIVLGLTGRKGGELVLPESPRGLASFVVMSAPVGPDEDEQARSESFTRSFELVQRGVDALRLVTASHIPTVTIERLWPTYLVLEQESAGPPRVVDAAVIEHGLVFRTARPATPELLERAAAFVTASFNRDPVENFRYLHLAAENAGLVDGDYAGAILKAAAAAEVLIKHTAAMLIWEATNYTTGEAPEWSRLPVPLAAKPRKLIAATLSPALKGNWSSQRSDQPMGAWRHHIAGVRNRVIHRGHRPSSDEVDDALGALRMLPAHINDRLAASAAKFPRTAVMLAGEPGLTSRGAWGKVRATVRHGSVQEWRDSYRTWVDSMDTGEAADED